MECTPYISWNEWTSRNNCLELDLHIDASESLKSLVQSYLYIFFATFVLKWVWVTQTFLKKILSSPNLF